MNAIQITNFSKTYGDTQAVKDLTLSVPKGEFFGLLGHNGAGKSTTIHCITGISTIDEGEILVMGKNVKDDYQETRAMIGLSPQEFNADIFVPIEVTMDFVGGYFGMPKAERKERIEHLLDMMDLIEHRKKPFQALSGGLKRRAILARALMHDPEILILDEPTAGIDVEQRRGLWKYLQDLHKAGKTIILTSHYLEEVEHLCSRVAIMHEGAFLKELHKKDFKENGSLEETYLKLTGSTL